MHWACMIHTTTGKVGYLLQTRTVGYMLHTGTVRYILHTGTVGNRYTKSRYSKVQTFHWDYRIHTTNGKVGYILHTGIGQ